MEPPGFFRPPEDPELRNIIDKSANFVARFGPSFEEKTKSKQADNPKFSFLFGGEYYQYYIHRVRVERDILNQMEAPYGPRMPPPPPQMGPQGFYPPGQSGPSPPPHHAYGPPPPFGPFGPPPNQMGRPQYNEPPPHFAPPPPPHHFQHQIHSHQQPPPQFPPSTMGPPSHLQMPPQMFQSQTPPLHANMPPPSQQALPPPFNNNWEYQQSPPQHQPPPPQHQYHPQPPPMQVSTPPIDSLTSNGGPEKDSAVLADIDKAREEINKSEQNLAAQHKVLMEDALPVKIEEMINKTLDDEVKRMCEDYSINLNEFDRTLTPIIETCRKESIASGKSWIFNNCTTQEHYDAVAKHLLKRITRIPCTFDAKLHLMYLINDLYNHCMRKGSEHLREAINNIIVPAFCTTVIEADEDRKQKMIKLLKLWEMNQYLETPVLDQLKTPRTSLDAYKNSLYTRFDEQIQQITNEQTIKYGQLSKQHSEYKKHKEGIIQKLQQQLTQPFSGTNGPPPNSNVYGLGPPQQQQGQMPGGPPMTPNHGMNNFPSSSLSPSLGHGSFPPPDFFQISNTPPGFPPSSAHHQPPMPPQQGPSGTSQPHVPFPHPQMAPHDPLVEEIRPPYFDMPAGIMTMYIKMEDFDYKPIDPDIVRIPPVTPPTERLTKAIEAFYGPPSHELPRNAEGWEKLGLYEFFRAKSKARQEFEEREGLSSQEAADEGKETASNGIADSNKPTKKEEDRKERTPSPPKRRYKEFKEDKDESKSSAKTTRGSRSSSRSPSPKVHRSHKSKHSRSRTRSRSRSRSRSPHRSRRGKHVKNRSPPASGVKPLRRSRSISPPPFQPFRIGFSSSTATPPQVPLSESNKGHQMLKKMGWSGAGGLGAKESGIQDPISAGEVRDRVDQYKGIGTSIGASDPFESYRRNKSQTYVKRIKDARQ